MADWRRGAGPTAAGPRWPRLLALALVLAVMATGGCAAPWAAGSNRLPAARSAGAAAPSPSGESPGGASAAAAPAAAPAPGTAAAAHAWLQGGRRTAGQIVARLMGAPPHSPAAAAYVQALTARCPSAVPAAAARLAALGRGVRADGGQGEALGQVLATCPVPTGSAARTVSRDLLHYLRSPLAAPWGPFLQRAVDRDVPAASLRGALPGMSRGGVLLAVPALAGDPGALLTAVVDAQHGPSGREIADAAGSLPFATLERWFEDGRLTDRAVRVRLLAAMARRAPSGPAYDAWLRRAAEAERDPAVAELLWSRLYLADRGPAALTRLNRLADRYGTFRLDPWLVNVWDWRVLRAAAAADPGGFLARGIRAYEAVEGGRPYFVVGRCPPASGRPCQPFVYGNRQFDPAREIPGWKAFLKQYARHPAAADAAYRLARCEEILGHWEQALTYMHQAADLYPDGQIAYQARGRLIFMLDIEVPLAALRTLAAQPPTPALAPAVRYALAVRELRHGQYARAAASLAANPPPDRRLLPWATWPTAAQAARQRAEAAQMATLAKSAFAAPWSPIPPSGGSSGPRANFAAPPRISGPRAAYALAALLFHRNLLLYDDMWDGDQQAFFAFQGFVNHVQVEGDLSPQWVRQLRAMNGYIEAEPVFAAVAADPRAPAALRARALYSAGECLVHLDGYNVATDATMQKAVLRAEIVRTFRSFAALFPHQGALTRDALLTVARYTRSPADVAAVERAAPGTWQAAAARALLMPHPGTVMAARSLGDLGFQQIGAPGAAVAAGGAGPAPGSGERSRVLADGWTLAWVAPPDLPAGAGVEVLRIAGLGPGRARVDWRVVPASQQPDLPWAAHGPVALVRVPAVLHTVTFSRQRYPYP